MLKIVSGLAVAMVFLAFKSDKNAYMIFDVKGKPCHYAKMLERAKEADQDSIDNLTKENEGWGDFILVTPTS